MRLVVTTTASLRWEGLLDQFEVEDLRLWREGDLLAFERVVLRHQAAVYHFALRLLGDGEAASDVAQETFIRAYQSISTFRGSSALRTWLFSICRNLSLDELRRRQRRVERETSLEPVTESSPSWPVDTDPLVDDEAERHELAAKLDEALAKLPEEQRAAVILKDRHGLSCEEVAKVLGVPVGTVFSRVHRAYRKLATYMDPYVNGTDGAEREVSVR